MENKHTPGPWIVEKCRYGFAVYASKTSDAVVKTEDVEGRYGAIDNEADARLIAAAPELLAALEGMEKWASSIHDGCPPSTALEAARAAIAKANGRSEMSKSIPEAVVEAVARAICVACEENPDHQGDARGNEFRWHDYRDVALAAISAFTAAQQENKDE